MDSFANRLRILAAWLDKYDLDATSFLPSSDEVQQDLRRVAAGLDEDPTLGDMMTDLLRNGPTVVTGTPTVRIRVRPRTNKERIILSGQAYVESSTGQKFSMELTPMSAAVGDDITWNLHIDVF